MSRVLALSTNGQAKEIWKDVRRAAEKTPEWVKQQVLRASQETVSKIQERSSGGYAERER